MRSRITAVSLGKGATMGKIGITCRQPFLGADDWIAEEIKNVGKDTDKPAKEIKNAGKDTNKPAKEAKVEAS